MNIKISPFSLGSGLFFRPRKLIGCAIAAAVMIVLGVLATGALIFFSWQRQQRLARLTVEAPAQVLEVNAATATDRRAITQPGSPTASRRTDGQ